MPILKREPDVFPQSLFTLSEVDFPWWVAHVRSRQEKSLARYLRLFGIAFYLPQREQRIQRKSRDFVSYLPLFPGYVFFRGSKEHCSTAWRSNLVARLLDVHDQGLLNRELAQLRELQQGGASLVPHRYGGPGDKVRITDGPFQGYTGVVLQEKGRLRLVVSVSLLRRAVAVEFEREILAPFLPASRPAGRARRAFA